MAGPLLTFSNTNTHNICTRKNTQYFVVLLLFCFCFVFFFKRNDQQMNNREILVYIITVSKLWREKKHVTLQVKQNTKHTNDTTCNERERQQGEAAQRDLLYLLLILLLLLFLIIYVYIWFCCLLLLLNSNRVHRIWKPICEIV